jgi:hypothetical protein
MSPKNKAGKLTKQTNIRSFLAGWNSRITDKTNNFQVSINNLTSVISIPIPKKSHFIKKFMENF